MQTNGLELLTFAYWNINGFDIQSGWAIDRIIKEKVQDLVDWCLMTARRILHKCLSAFSIIQPFIEINVFKS